MAEVSPLKEVLAVSGLIEGEAPAVVFLTAGKWAKLAGELMAQSRTPAILTPQNFRELIVGNTKFVNTGMDDEAVVNAMNRIAAERINFQGKRARLISGRA